RRVAAPNPAQVAEKVVRACLEGKVATVEGDVIDVEFESICFHSDTPGALAMATAMRAALERNGIRIAPPAQFVAQSEPVPA
ncbi:MAG: LamB/YcsF family protein, partial [Janthinobacterium lividum]